MILGGSGGPEPVSFNLIMHTFLSQFFFPINFEWIYRNVFLDNKRIKENGKQNKK